MAAEPAASFFSAAASFFSAASAAAAAVVAAAAAGSGDAKETLGAAACATGMMPGGTSARPMPIFAMASGPSATSNSRWSSFWRGTWTRSSCKLRIAGEFSTTNAVSSSDEGCAKSRKCLRSTERSARTPCSVRRITRPSVRASTDAAAST